MNNTILEDQNFTTDLEKGFIIAVYCNDQIVGEIHNIRYSVSVNEEGGKKGIAGNVLFSNIDEGIEYNSIFKACILDFNTRSMISVCDMELLNDYFGGKITPYEEYTFVAKDVIHN